MPRLSASLWIHAAPEHVYQTCQAPPAPLLPRGGPRLVIPDPPGEVGSRYRWEFRRFGFQGSLESLLIEAAPGRLLRFRGHTNWDMDADLILQPEGEGTRLRFRMRYRLPIPWRWLVPGGLIRLGLWHGLRRVQALTEKASAGRATGSSIPM